MGGFEGMSGLSGRVVHARMDQTNKIREGGMRTTICSFPLHDELSAGVLYCAFSLAQPPCGLACISCGCGLHPPRTRLRFRQRRSQFRLLLLLSFNFCQLPDPRFLVNFDSHRHRVRMTPSPVLFEPLTLPPRSHDSTPFPSSTFRTTGPQADSMALARPIRVARYNAELIKRFTQ